MNRPVSTANPDDRLSRRSAIGRLTGAGAAAVIAAAGLGMSRDTAQGAPSRVRSSIVTAQEGNTMTDATPGAASGPLTVVLVHGAFADASNWAGVIPILQAAGVNVLAPPNPLRGIDHDAAYIASVASQIPGPVLLVAHSYGGAVITNAGTRADNVRGLVYVGAFIPDEGETLQDLADQATDSKVLPGAATDALPDDPGVAAWHRVHHRPGVVPRDLLRRPAGGAGGDPGGLAASPRRGLVRRADAESGLEDASLVGDHLSPATSSSARPASASWPNAPAPPSPRSRPRTP